MRTACAYANQFPDEVAALMEKNRRPLSELTSLCPCLQSPRRRSFIEFCELLSAAALRLDACSGHSPTFDRYGIGEQEDSIPSAEETRSPVSTQSFISRGNSTVRPVGPQSPGGSGDSVMQYPALVMVSIAGGSPSLRRSRLMVT